MNFSSYEELYNVFSNTAVFQKRTNPRTGAILIPKLEADTVNISPKTNITIAIVNQAFNNGYIKFNGYITTRYEVRLNRKISRNTKGDKPVGKEFSGLFICKNEKNATMPFDLSTYYNLYLMKRKMMLKMELNKVNRVSRNEYGEYEYTEYSLYIPNRYGNILSYDYMNSVFDCYYINLENKDKNNVIKQKEVEPSSKGDSAQFTLPTEKIENSRFSEGDTIQIIAQRRKEMFNFPQIVK